MYMYTHQQEKQLFSVIYWLFTPGLLATDIHIQKIIFLPRNLSEPPWKVVWFTDCKVCFDYLSVNMLLTTLGWLFHFSLYFLLFYGILESQDLDSM